MDRFPYADEARETALITETRAQFAALARDILKDEEAATKRITEALQEYIADDNTAAALVRATLLNAQALLPVLTDLIWDEAAKLAEVEVERKERNRVEAADDARIERTTWAQALH